MGASGTKGVGCGIGGLGSEACRLRRKLGVLGARSRVKAEQGAIGSVERVEVVGIGRRERDRRIMAVCIWLRWVERRALKVVVVEVWWTVLEGS